MFSIDTQTVRRSGLGPTVRSFAQVPLSSHLVEDQRTDLELTRRVTPSVRTILTNLWYHFPVNEVEPMEGSRLIENVNLSDIKFSDEGDSVTFHLVEMMPPYKHCRLECQNVYSFIMHRSPDDRIPYFIGELVWRELTEGEKHTALERAEYPIFDQNGAFFACGRIIAVHVEGGICCDILAENVTLIDATPSGQ